MLVEAAQMQPALLVDAEGAGLQDVVQPAEQGPEIHLGLAQLLQIGAQFLHRRLAGALIVVEDAAQLAVQAAQMGAALLVDAEPAALDRLGEARDHGPHLRLALGQLDHELGLGPQLVRQPADAIEQGGHLGIGLHPAFLAAAHDALQILQIVGGLLQQRLDIDRDRRIAIAGRHGPVRRVRSESHSSSSLKKRFWAWPASSSR
jgi:hypothetical protein